MSTKNTIGHQVMTGQDLGTRPLDHTPLPFHHTPYHHTPSYSIPSIPLDHWIILAHMTGTNQTLAEHVLAPHFKHRDVIDPTGVRTLSRPAGGAVCPPGPDKIVSRPSVTFWRRDAGPGLPDIPTWRAPLARPCLPTV